MKAFAVIVGTLTLAALCGVALGASAARDYQPGDEIFARRGCDFTLPSDSPAAMRSCGEDR